MMNKHVIDWHSHVLPDMDDGSKGIEMSLDMLRTSRKLGITHVLATPHFYADHESPQIFLERRKEKAALLQSAIIGQTDWRRMELENSPEETDQVYPEVIPGAECSWFYGMSGMEQLDELCIGRTKLLLLEMPFYQWSNNTIKEVEGILNRGLIPVIAHLERFLSCQKDRSALEYLMELPVVMQFNGDSLEGFLRKRPVLRLMSELPVFLLGSDMHNTENRAQNLLLVREKLRKHFGPEYLENLDRYGDGLLFGTNQEYQKGLL